MLHQILLEQGISERLLSQATGERDLTDFLHLAEILQQAATLHESEAALLSWFEKTNSRRSSSRGSNSFRK